jgi:two-component system osmolarity sensor histidine kinase EnvZ
MAMRDDEMDEPQRDPGTAAAAGATVPAGTPAGAPGAIGDAAGAPDGPTGAGAPSALPPSASQQSTPPPSVVPVPPATRRGRVGSLVRRVYTGYRLAARRLAEAMPKGLYARTLLIVVLPMLILQSVAAYVFMERHWQTVTRRLSESVARSIATGIELIEKAPTPEAAQAIMDTIRRNQSLTFTVLEGGELPPPLPKPFFSLYDDALGREIVQFVNRPFWIDTVGRSDLVEVRVKLADHVVQILARRSQTYASNSFIFLGWLFGTSVVLLGIAILFLRNQIRPILQLADAADSFGKGRPIADFQPHGAREVRRASLAFLAMKRRIERQIEQRTTMLAGVSHDMRTVLTRFRLQLALLGSGPEIEGLEADVGELQAMLEAYLAFARGDGDEVAAPTDVGALLASLAEAAERGGLAVTHGFDGEPEVVVRPNALRRALANLVGNAGRHADSVAVTARHADGWLTILVDDDGPGIPEAERENVFRPFYRLDQARNQDAGGTGLGLAICRDIIRSHGGDVKLDASPMGGLRAIIRIPG